MGVSDGVDAWESLGNVSEGIGQHARRASAARASLALVDVAGNRLISLRPTRRYVAGPNVGPSKLCMACAE
jgi:hypothetical protein